MTTMNAWQRSLWEEAGWLGDIGAAVRLAPIGDIKTMIYAFLNWRRVEKVRLHSGRRR